MAIKSFGDKATEKLWSGGRVRAFEQIAPAARRKLDALDQATGLLDLASVPGNRLDKKLGQMAGWYTIRVSDKWRILFKWTAEGPTEVRLTDYH